MKGKCQVHSSFNRFNSLEMEVRKRDEIISQLQSRILELERVGGMESRLGGLEMRGDLHQTSGSTQEEGGMDDPPSVHADVISALTASSGSDDFSQEHGFMVS